MKKVEGREQLEVQELRERIDELLRIVESGKTVELVDHGQIVAQVVPAQDNTATLDEAEQRHQKEIDRWLADMDRLAEEIGKKWPAGISAVDAVRDARRDL